MIYPQKINAHKSDFIIKIFILVSIIIAIILFIINKLTTPQIPWAALTIAGQIYIWITVLYAINKNINIAGHVLIQTIAISLLTFYIDYSLKFKGWSLEENGSTIIQETDIVTVNNILFSVDPNLYDTYWNENTCETTPIYFQFYNGSSSHYIITSEEPETWENGSPDNSTGFEDDQNSGIRDDEGGKFDPDKLCENGNCDISLDNFCGEPTVARTLKFVGLLLFIAKILVPAIIIIMGFVNLFKIITSGKEDDAKKYAKTIVRNIVIGVVIFLVPTIIQMVFDAADDIISPDERSDFANCVNCILDPNDESACIIRESD